MSTPEFPKYLVYQVMLISLYPVRFLHLIFLYTIIAINIVTPIST